MSKFKTLQKVLAADKAEAHCYNTWLAAGKELEQVQLKFNEAMNMSAGEDLPIEMKASLSDFISQLYNLQQQHADLMEELREVDAGAPAKEAQEEEEEAAESSVTAGSDKEFIDYLMDFYGPQGLYANFFPEKPVTPQEIKEALDLRKKVNDPPFEGDTVDRELVRDIMFAKRGKKDTEHDVSKFLK